MPTKKLPKAKYLVLEIYFIPKQLQMSHPVWPTVMKS